MFTVKTELSKELGALGVKLAPMHMKVLKVLSVKAPCTAQNLVGVLERDKAQITRVVQDLLSANLIERTPNPDDKRSQLLTLNHKAYEVLEGMNSAEKLIIERLSKDISSEEIEQFKFLAQKFRGNL